MVSSINTVGTISSAGVGSGLDVASIVNQLMQIERRPLVALESEAAKLNTKLSTFGKLQSYFAALRDKSADLSSSMLWSAHIATSADSAAVKASTDTAAVAGNYAVQVDKLAVGQTVNAAALPSGASMLSEGMLTIELGTWTGTPTSGFAAKAGSTPVDIQIGPGETSLTAIRDKINAAGAGVTASIVTDLSGARLSIRSKDTGAENAFRITATETVDDGVAGTGLSALGYSAVGATQMNRTQEASNARATINGIAVTSASNVLTHVIDGLSFTLLKATGSPVDVSVVNDTEAIKKKITDFVTAFNDLANYLRTQTAYDAGTRTAGALQGDQSVTSLQRQLRDVLNQASTASSNWSRLSDVGLSLKRDGTLEVAATKLDNALGNLTDLRKLLATDGVDNASTGFMRRWKEMADAALGASGTFATRKASLDDRIRSNEKSQDAMELRLAQTESRLRAQYTALDTRMAALNSLSSYVAQQMKALSANTGNDR